jgi:hypothetical protein
MAGVLTHRLGLLAAAGMGGVPTAGSKWRLYVNRNGAASLLTDVVIGEIEMRATPGGADQCTGGTATASSTNTTLVASNAFADDGGTTIWGSAATHPVWIEYDFGTSVTVQQVAITARSSGDTSRSPHNIDVQVWDGATWQTSWKILSDDWATSETKIFTKPALGLTKRFWRVNISLCQTTQFPSCSLLEFRTSASGPQAATGGQPIGESALDSVTYRVQNVFDANNATFWVTLHGFGEMPDWIGYDFGADVNIVEMAFRNRPDGFGVNESPKDFTIEYSGDGDNWTVAKTVTGEAAWAAGETRVYSIP